MNLKEYWERCYQAIDENWVRAEPRNGTPGPSIVPPNIGNWLKEHCQGQWVLLNGHFYFQDSKDATLFILKWT